MCLLVLSMRYFGTSSSSTNSDEVNKVTKWPQYHQPPTTNHQPLLPWVRNLSYYLLKRLKRGDSGISLSCPLSSSLLGRSSVVYLYLGTLYEVYYTRSISLTHFILLVVSRPSSPTIQRNLLPPNTTHSYRMMLVMTGYLLSSASSGGLPRNHCLGGREAEWLKTIHTHWCCDDTAGFARLWRKKGGVLYVSYVVCSWFVGLAWLYLWSQASKEV